MITGVATSKPCGPVCAIYCEHGNVMDSQGCPTCECKPDPGSRCPPVCAIYCPNGNEEDSNGCPTCKCKPECPPECEMYCPAGKVMDGNGCPTCQCKPEKKPFYCQPFMCRLLFCNFRSSYQSIITTCDCQCSQGWSWRSIFGWWNFVVDPNTGLKRVYVMSNKHIVKIKSIFVDFPISKYTHLAELLWKPRPP